MSPALQVEPGDYDNAEDPRNRLLDGFEAALEAMLATAEANDCKFQFLQRLARHCPQPAPEPTVATVQPDANAELELTIVIGAFTRLMRRDLSGVEHKVVAQMKERASAELQALKLARGA